MKPTTNGMVLTANGTPFTVHVKHHFSKLGDDGVSVVWTEKPATIVTLHVGQCEGDLTHEAPDMMMTTGKAQVAISRHDMPTKREGRKLAFARAVNAMWPQVAPVHRDYQEYRSTRRQLWTAYWKACPPVESPQRLAKLFKQARHLAKLEYQAYHGDKRIPREEVHAISRKLDAILLGQ